MQRLLTLAATPALLAEQIRGDGVCILFLHFDLDRRRMQLHQFAERQVILVLELIRSVRFLFDFRQRWR